MNTKQIEAAYKVARDRYAEFGVDTDSALKRLAKIPISLHCWQGDDVGGFENTGAGLGGGTQRHRQLPRQGPHARRTARRPRQSPLASSPANTA